MSNDVIEMDTGPRAVAVAATNAVTPADLLRHALDSGADLDRLEKLMDLQDRWEANEARKAFADAMADFKLDPPKVFKDKHVSFKTSNGQTEYDHATLGNANDIIIAALARHGFSHRWITSQRDGQVIVDCVLTHRKGHSQTNTLMSAPDQSGGKNSIQAIISARSYLERHTLFDATGLAPKDAEDDDGRGACDPEPEPILPKGVQRTPIAGKAFERAVASIVAGTYTCTELRHYYTFTPDQETALANLEAKPT